MSELGHYISSELHCIPKSSKGADDECHIKWNTPNLFSFDTFHIDNENRKKFLHPFENKLTCSIWVSFVCLFHWEITLENNCKATSTAVRSRWSVAGLRVEYNLFTKTFAAQDGTGLTRHEISWVNQSDSGEPCQCVKCLLSKHCLLLARKFSRMQVTRWKLLSSSTINVILLDYLRTFFHLLLYPLS